MIRVQKNSVVPYDWIRIVNNMVPDGLRPVNTEFDYLVESGLDIDIRFMLILHSLKVSTRTKG